MDIIVSFPRSGNHMVRFIIEYIIAYPTKGCNKKDTSISKNKFKTTDLMNHVKYEPYIINKYHSIKDLSFENINSFILLIRDFKECIPNNSNYNKKLYDENILLYSENIKLFNKFNGPKLCIYYENLVIGSTKCTSTIIQIIQFIIVNNLYVSHLSPNEINSIFLRLQYFIKNHEKLLTECLHASNRYWGGNNSNLIMDYHSKRIPFNERAYIYNNISALDDISIFINQYLTHIPVYILLSGGLCNRLRAIEYYILLCKQKNTTIKPIFIWEKSNACPGLYEHIFTNNNNIINSRNNIIVDYDGSLLNHISQFNDEIYQQISLDIFIPLPNILSKALHFITHIIKNDFISIHVRRTDHIQLSKSKNLFTPLEKFDSFINKYHNIPIVYLATDNENTQNYFLQKYGEKRIVFFTKIYGNSNKIRNTTLEEAFIDILICSRSKFFKGTTYSSFTDIINIYRNKFNYTLNENFSTTNTH